MPTNIGRMNRLRVVKEKDFGVYLDADQLGEILLPKRYVPNSLRIGDELEVFVSFGANSSGGRGCRVASGFC